MTERNTIEYAYAIKLHTPDGVETAALVEADYHHAVSMARILAKDCYDHCYISVWVANKECNGYELREYVS